MEDALDAVAPGRPDEDEHVVDVLRGREDDLLVLDEVAHLEVEAAVHLGVDDEADGVEGIGEDLVERQVPGAGLGLVRHEDDHGLARPLFKLHLGDSRAEPLDVAGEGVGEEVLARAVELQLLGDFRAGHEDVPRQLVDLAAVPAGLVGNDQVQVIAHMGDVGVDEQGVSRQEVTRLGEEFRVDVAVTYETADVCLNHRKRNPLPHRSSSPLLCDRAQELCYAISSVGHVFLPLYFNRK